MTPLRLYHNEYSTVDVFSSDCSPVFLAFPAGSVLNVTCNIRSSKCNKTSSDLRFTIELRNRNRTINVPESLVKVVNSTAVELNYPNIPLYFNGAMLNYTLDDNRTCGNRNFKDNMLLFVDCKYLCFFFHFIRLYVARSMTSLRSTGRLTLYIACS